MHLSSLEHLDTLELEAAFTESDTTLLSSQLKSCSLLKYLTLWLNEDSCGIMKLVTAASHLANSQLYKFCMQKCTLNENVVNVLSDAMQSPKCSLKVLKFHQMIFLLLQLPLQRTKVLLLSVYVTVELRMLQLSV